MGRSGDDASQVKIRRTGSFEIKSDEQKIFNEAVNGNNGLPQMEIK